MMQTKQRSKLPYDPSALSTKATEKIILEDKYEREKKQLEVEEMQNLILKRKQYGKFIHKQFAPKVSEEKKAELENLISRSAH